MSETTTFHFVEWSSNACGSNPNPATRLLIRKQAMSKAAAARRKRGDWGKHNLGQSIVVFSEAPTVCRETVRRRGSWSSADHGLPSSPIDAGSSTGSVGPEPDALHSGKGVEVDGDAESPPEQSLTYCPTVPANMASTGYQMLRMKCNFDILDLSALTTFHVGRITTEGLYACRPRGLINVLQCRQWSYFSYIPCRYGHFPCLDDATRCVASRVRGWVEGEVKPNATVLALYVKALNSLQAAVNDPVLCLEPETLCATAVLSIYELLDNTRSFGWAQHAAGAKSLVKLRGPENFQTPFEKALFMAQVGPMYTESVIDNLDCFLHEPPWQAVLVSVPAEPQNTTSPFSDSGAVVVSLWSHLAYLPSLWKEVQAAICSTSAFLPPRTLTNLQQRITTLDANFTHWRSNYETQLLAPPPAPFTNELKAEKRFETLGICLAGLIILKRLAVALNPLAAWAADTEDSAQRLSQEILELERRAVMANPRAALFMRFKRDVAVATVGTTGEWRVGGEVLGGDDDDARVGKNGCIKRGIYERWCVLKGRRV